MSLRHHLGTFIADLAVFSEALRPGHRALQHHLAALAERLPELLDDRPFVVIGSPLHEALALTLTFLGLARHRGAAPSRAVSRLERRVARLFDLGAALEPHSRRPTGRAPVERHRLRRGSLAPSPLPAYGRG